MACTTCDPKGDHETGGFASEAAFLQEEARITKLVLAGCAVSERGWSSGEYSFVCKRCAQAWELAMPDGPMRGHLRKVSAREPQIRALRSKRGPGPLGSV